MKRLTQIVLASLMLFATSGAQALDVSLIKIVSYQGSWYQYTGTVESPALIPATELVAGVLTGLKAKQTDPEKGYYYLCKARVFANIAPNRDVNSLSVYGLSNCQQLK